MDKSKKIKYVSLTEASRVSNYTSDYLGSLIRKKKLGGKKIGRDWFTTMESLGAYLSFKKHLPIAEELVGRPTFLFSVRTKIKPKLIFLFLIILGLISFGVFMFNPLFTKKNEKGDFDKTVKLDSKEVLIGETKDETLKEIQTLNITSYPSDDAGGIEISVEANPQEEK